MAAVHTAFVGCKVSQADSEAVAAALAASGHSAATDAAHADVCVVVTCGVTQEAERKSRRLVRRLASAGAPVVVGGCAATLRPGQFDEPGGRVTVVSDVIGEGGLESLLAQVRARSVSLGAAEVPETRDAVDPGEVAVTRAPTRPAGRTRFTLKVQDGCAGRCSYCAVRLARGTPRSVAAAEAVRAAAAALDQGCGEIVLSGVDLGAYHDSSSGGDLAALVARLTALPGLLRLRLSSLEPRHLTPRLLDALAHERVARHVHVPLQSADDGVLAAMGRPYSFAEFRALVEHARERIAGLAFTTDVLVGFPGESDDAFAATLAAIGPPDGLFSRLHVFAYSPRPGTAAAVMPPVRAEIVRRRRDAALAAADDARRAAAARRAGELAEVLVEEYRDGCWRGYSSDYVRYYLTGEARSGTLVPAVGERPYRDGLKGRVA